jgi:hypothetical protein
VRRGKVFFFEGKKKDFFVRLSRAHPAAPPVTEAFFGTEQSTVVLWCV